MEILDSKKIPEDHVVNGLKVIKPKTQALNINEFSA